MAENVYSDLIADKSTVGLDLWDWLFGTFLPGKYGSYKIMASLVACTPTLRSYGAASWYDSGLILEQATYWRQRTVLGRVLGGLRSVKGVCGWVGPAPAVKVFDNDGIGLPAFQGYLRVHARAAEFKDPSRREDDDDDDDAEGGVPAAGRSLRPRPGESKRSFLTDLSDMQKWTSPLEPGTSMVTMSLQMIKLKKMPLEGGKDETHREAQASIVFLINNSEVLFTLYTLPTFVTAHPCVGVHVVHEREMGNYTRNVVEMNQLKGLGQLKKGL